MRELLRQSAEKKSAEFKKQAEARVIARQKLLDQIAAHHAEQIQLGRRLPDLETYTQECLNLVTDYRRVATGEIPASVEQLTGKARRRKLAEFRREQRDSERIIRVMSGDLGFSSVRDMIHTIRSEMSARRELKKSK